MLIDICDDSSLDRDIIADFLSNYFSEKGIEYRINIYENGSNLIYDIQDGALPDIIFLDIYLENGEMGIEVARKLRQNNYCGSIVFLTASADFAIDSYDVEASGYLLKPHSYEKLCGVMDRIVKNITVDFKSYNISVRGGIVRIPRKNITYVESNNSKCIVHTSKNEEYTVYKRLSEIEQELNDRCFLRCHQSFLVNMDYILRADKEFTLTNGDTVSIRQRSLKMMKKMYLDYLKEKES